MPPIPYAGYLIDLCRNPADALTDHSTARTHQERLRLIGETGAIIESSGRYSVTVSLSGAQGDILKTIRKATDEEWTALNQSGAVRDFLKSRDTEIRRKLEAELADLKAWTAANDRKIRDFPHPVYEIGIKGHSLKYALDMAENSNVLQQVLTYRWVKNLITKLDGVYP